jgi:HAD superfamily hydrolase (TIGR01509 family)
MQHKYCIFDMDGTLVDSMAHWKNLEREFLQVKGITENIDEVLKDIQHMSIPGAMEYFLDRFHFEGTVESLTDELNAMMAAHYASDVDVKPGVPAYLEKLKQQGVKMCIASATSVPLVTICLERLGLKDYFEFFLSCVDVNASKDKPDVFLEAARRLGGSPAETAVYEDSLVATTTAKNAGFYVVGIYDENSAHYWEGIKELADELIEIDRS